MMYEFPALEAELTQGDIIDDCPILSWTNLQSSDSTQWELGQSKERHQWRASSELRRIPRRPKKIPKFP